MAGSPKRREIGHGRLANKADLEQVVDMIEDTYAFVQEKKASVMSEEDIIEAGLDSKWASWAWRFITEERWIKTLYQ